MKRKIAVGMIFLAVLFTAVSVSVSISSASITDTDTLSPTSNSNTAPTVCESGCGPYTLRCSEVETYSKGRHPIILQGYHKTCEYNIHSVYTIYECTRCGSRTVKDVHAHGESDHTYPFICGGVNERICSLDGQVYSITPMDELTPVYEPIE